MRRRRVTSVIDYFYVFYAFYGFYDFYDLPLTFGYSGVRMVTYGFVHLLLEILHIQNSLDILVSIL